MVGDAGGVEVEGELVLGFEAFDEGLEVADGDAKEGFAGAVFGEDFFDGGFAEGAEFFYDLVGGFHLVAFT